jgi:hypothetical protein
MSKRSKAIEIWNALKPEQKQEFYDLYKSTSFTLSRTYQELTGREVQLILEKFMTIQHVIDFLSQEELKELYNLLKEQYEKFIDLETAFSSNKQKFTHHLFNDGEYFIIENDMLYDEHGFLIEKNDYKEYVNTKEEFQTGWRFIE